MLRNVLKGALIISLVLSIYTVKTYAAEKSVPEQFPDLPTGWSRDSVINAVNNGLLNGIDGKLLPKSYLTRAQLAAIVNRAFGTTIPADLSLFVDVPADSWYYDELSYSVGNQTLVGYNNRLFPDRDATREEVFVVLARVMDPEHPDDLSAIRQFSDFDLVSGWAAYDLAAMIETGYMHGAGGKLQPKTKITREEFAYVIDQFSDRFIGNTQLDTEVGIPPSPPPEYELVPNNQEVHDYLESESESNYSSDTLNEINSQTIGNEEAKPAESTLSSVDVERGFKSVFDAAYKNAETFVSDASEESTSQLYTYSRMNVVKATGFFDKAYLFCV